jgi:hypothetical protein
MSATNVRECRGARSLGKNKQRKITGDSLSTVRLEAHEITRVCTYPVVGKREVNMFRNLIDVSYAHGQYRERNGPCGTQ